MTDRFAQHLEIELPEIQTPGQQGVAGYCVARVTRVDTGDSRFTVGDFVLVPGQDGARPGPRVSTEYCIAVPLAMPLETALAVPPLALALWIWDAASLEPGEVAVYTSGSLADRLLAVVAGWRSARDVIRLDVGGNEHDPPPGVVGLTVAEPEQAGSALSSAMRSAPGVVAAILTPRTVALDVILESLPMWGRVVVAKPSSEPATVDFYNNVHRKGCSIYGIPGPSACFTEPALKRTAASHIARAVRILGNDRLAASCLR